MATKITNNNKGFYLLAIARIAMGLTFLWAFFDKLFGLGFATCRDAKTDAVSVMCEKAWLSGGSPTTGFLKFAAKGPFEPFYQSLAGNGFIDVLFMSGLFLIGLSLVLGIGMKVATTAGTLLFLMMWSAVLWPENNPLIDDHIVYSLLLLTLLTTNTNQKWGLRNWWTRQDIVKRYPVLE
jgi:thiosulfate dehydrogenase [quinone] large subunit